MARTMRQNDANLNTTSKWALVESGQVLAKYSTIKECMDHIRRLHPNHYIGGGYVTDLVYNMRIECLNKEYTILWQCLPS